MSITIVKKIGGVNIYGAGSLGGKGLGLVQINACDIPRVHKLKTNILTTTFYDKFHELGGRFGDEEHAILASILRDLHETPISVRSSGTNESGFTEDGSGSVQAGENVSFMLPNTHPDFSCRFHQLKQAIEYIYRDFLRKQPPDSRNKMSIVINPIPGIHDETFAGPIYFPLISGVANSYFPHALKKQNPKEGFARIAFGHGYATVLDEFSVISMATIQNPIPLDLIGEGQRYFYAIDMTKNENLQGDDMETMKMLHIRLADCRFTTILGKQKDTITLKPLLENDKFKFKSGLMAIMDALASKISRQFQIEFVFNVDLAQGDEASGVFYIVQLTLLPDLAFNDIQLPEHVRHTYLSLVNFQGHGIKKNIKYVLVVSPFIYCKDMQIEVRNKIAAINGTMRKANAAYILITPGRLGTRNKDWGIHVEYKDIDQAAAIFEYGIDIAGRQEPLPEPEHPDGGGIYGSHFLYMLQGGYDETQKKLQTRMFGTQGTHFLTNLSSKNVIYGCIMPIQDRVDPWLFRCSNENDPLALHEFPHPVSVYADFISQRCIVITESP